MYKGNGQDKKVFLWKNFISFSYFPRKEENNIKLNYYKGKEQKRVWRHIAGIYRRRRTYNVSFRIRRQFEIRKFVYFRLKLPLKMCNRHEGLYIQRNILVFDLGTIVNAKGPLSWLLNCKTCKNNKHVFNNICTLYRRRCSRLWNLYLIMILESKICLKLN